MPLRARLKVTDGPPPSHQSLPITALLIDDQTSQLIVADTVASFFEDPVSHEVRGEIVDLVGKVTSLRWSPDRSKIVVASGIAGVGGLITIIDRASKKIRAAVRSHQDTVYARCPSPDGHLVASAGYDRRILVQRYRFRRSCPTFFDGHNGAIYDLDFDRSGKLLASFSADETIKIWQVATGLRLDTLSQGEAEQYNRSLQSRWKSNLGVGCRSPRPGLEVEFHVNEKPSIRCYTRSLRTRNPLSGSGSARWKILGYGRRKIEPSSYGRLRDLTTGRRAGQTRDVPTDAVWSRDQSQLHIATLAGGNSNLRSR